MLYSQGLLTVIFSRSPYCYILKVSLLLYSQGLLTVIFSRSPYCYILEVSLLLYSQGLLTVIFSRSPYCYILEVSLLLYSQGLLTVIFSRSPYCYILKVSLLLHKLVKLLQQKLQISRCAASYYNFHMVSIQEPSKYATSQEHGKCVCLSIEGEFVQNC